MTAEDLRKLILSMTQDITFTYAGKPASICPFAPDDIAVAFGDFSGDYSSIDAAMTARIFDGKSLNEIPHAINLD